MKNSTQPIITYIPRFLKFCREEKKLSQKSVESYDLFLKRFVKWLTQSELLHLSPTNLRKEHIEKFKASLLGHKNPKTKRPLTSVSINLYLIALRSLLTFFAEKNISFLSPLQVKLLVEHPEVKKFQTSRFIAEKIVDMPSVTTAAGLRDRAILELLLATGIKVGQLTALNRRDIIIPSDNRNVGYITLMDAKRTHGITIPYTACRWLQKYLSTRTDNEPALFINYRRRSNSTSRLTARSIQLLVNRYSKKSV